MTLDEWVALTDGVGARAVAKIAGVARTTVARWRDGATRMPHAARVLLQITFRGELPPRALPLWAGWRIGHDALLYAPDLARGFTPADLYTLHWLKQSQSWREARRATTARAAADA